MRVVTITLIALALTAAAGVNGFAREPWPADEMDSLRNRLDTQAAEIRQLRQLLQSQAAASQPLALPPPGDTCDGGPVLRRLPVVVEHRYEPSCTEGDAAPSFHKLRYYADYDNGFVIRPYDPKAHPFDLKVVGWGQFRHHAFSRDVTTWTDNAGVTRPVENRNAFDVERARLQLSGHALDERLTYFVHLDGDTDGSETVDFFDYWWAWEFGPRLQIQMGKRKVPGSRQWILGARHTRLVDRPMATEFFRPDRSVGVCAVGQLAECDNFELMVSNGYRTANLPLSAGDDQMSVALSHSCDPWGDYGNPLVDYNFSDTPLSRLGHSFVYSPQSGNALGAPRDDSDFLRLADGTRLTQTGALAAGVTVSEFDVYFYGVDLGLKWRGWSINAEGYLRWLEQIEGNGALPVDSILQQGFYVEGGTFLVARKLDVNLRYSEVRDPYATAAEWAAGLNWYPLDTHRMKVSFDLTLLDGSPVQNTTTDFNVGDDGLLLRTQLQAEF